MAKVEVGGSELTRTIFSDTGKRTLLSMNALDHFQRNSIERNPRITQFVKLL